MACEHGYLDVAVTLMEAGADIDNKNEDERTPMHLAAKEGRVKYVFDIRQNNGGSKIFSQKSTFFYSYMMSVSLERCVLCQKLSKVKLDLYPSFEHCVV